ncbi:hypothetical protein [Catenuloplanes indicus]|uniref:Uncharacterized protein n=1 Tax=Catenuloplanes indicus TaxID=137267 RepID=A0AAE4AVG5_9ACTN|nr:hypothetical protein [Catenuloplanes indicus]MDQ0363977.1 hypothetical protein [Catenuloplanes indicus]
MSLEISVWVPDEGAYAGRKSVGSPPGVSTGVGAENFRYELWGSSAARSLGATFLPQLADITEQNRGNLQVPPDQLDALEQECRLLENNVEHLSDATIRDRDRILYYLTNIYAAIHRARAVGGGVVIW